MSQTPMLVPTRIVLHKVSRVLEVEFGDGFIFRLPSEYLRVYSPSAEVRGHGPGQEVLQVGKRDVAIDAIEPVGHYAIQPQFSDGHFSGIYSWDLLYRLGREQEALWADYLARLDAAGSSRDPALAAPQAPARACGDAKPTAAPAKAADAAGKAGGSSTVPAFGAALSRKRP
ncbi:MAG: DUF971 domain-containing protein [Betaproteobacteria bacterium]|nr:DUF971 domain-containing protein [Betaproteobacteria bacterium]